LFLTINDIKKILIDPSGITVFNKNNKHIKKLIGESELRDKSKITIGIYIRLYRISDGIYI